MNEIILAGCAPTPLAGYLKALGVLRLLSVKYPDTRGFWRGNDFILLASLDRPGIEDFFLHDYAPTPIMAPWNGGSGFYEKDNKIALTAILKNTDPRFDTYRSCLVIVEEALTGMDRTTSPKGDDKASLLTRLRSTLPDAALGWFDASVLLAGDSPQYPPLLGTGGNDGRLDFTNNFMQCLMDVLEPDSKASSGISKHWLAAALFRDVTPELIKNAIGQFSPGQAGGPNATTGFGGTFQEAGATINPWDFVLMIEGALPFAAAAVRRNANDPFGVLSYPFTVRAVGAGSGSLGEGDAANARGELWMPLWSQPATYAEVHALMAEGRVAFGKKPARDALDFVRAVQHLGGYRGVQNFQRFGLLMRSGKAYLATPLSRVTISDQPQAHWLDELDNNGWLGHFRRFAQGDNIAHRFLTYRRQLEGRLFEFSGREPDKPEAQSLLILLGEIQAALADSTKARESMAPVPRLSEQWVIAADDRTPAFRIAKALAGLRGTVEEPLPLRAQLFPVHRRHNQWATPEAGEKYRICSGQQGRLVDTLRTLLERRLWLADKLEMHDKPLAGPAGVELDDIRAFLRDASMDARIAALLPGLSLCAIPEDTGHSTDQGAVPAAFALLKLSLTPDGILRSLGLLHEGQRLALPAGMPAQLATGNRGNRAVVTTYRRLRAAGLALLFTRDALPTLADIDPLRACAALLIPLRYGAVDALTRSITKQPEPDFA